MDLLRIRSYGGLLSTTILHSLCKTTTVVTIPNTLMRYEPVTGASRCIQKSQIMNPEENSIEEALHAE
jgi:hypothetical protein